MVALPRILPAAVAAAELSGATGMGAPFPTFSKEEGEEALTEGGSLPLSDKEEPLLTAHLQEAEEALAEAEDVVTLTDTVHTAMVQATAAPQ
jgi:hypothetical protein